MADWNGANLRLMSQTLFTDSADTGAPSGSMWYYTDTGPVGDLADTPGRATDGYDRGLRVGDLVFYYDSSRKWSYSLNVQTSQDTGDTQTGFGAAVLLGDTS